MNPSVSSSALPFDQPPPADHPESRKIRVLGWLLVVVGPCLSLAMAYAAYYLSVVIFFHGRSGSLAHWNGGPALTRMAFGLFGAVFLIGAMIFIGGCYQIRHGRRNPVIIALTLLLAAITACLVFGVISAK